MISTFTRTLAGKYGSSLSRGLSSDEIRTAAPSVFADEAHSRTSSRYSFLPTSSILEGMAAEGWLPVYAQEQSVRDPSREGFQKHILRFAHADQLGGMGNKGDERAEIVLMNSHDRTSAYQIHVGAFRQVCSNGLVLCDETFSRIRLSHQGFDASKVIEASVEIVKNIPEIMDGIKEMKALGLTGLERHAFAEAASILRFGDLESAPVRPEKLLEPRRHEDAKPDLWTTFNTVQENCIKGGQRDRFKRSHDGSRMPKSRAVKGIDGNVSLNKALHHLAEKMKALKA